MMEPSTEAVESVTRLQAFVRGSLCRARVSIMVKKLIDELMAAKSQPIGAAGASMAGDKKVQGELVVEEDLQRSGKIADGDDSPALSGLKENLSPGKLNKGPFKKDSNTGSIPLVPGVPSSPRKQHLKDAVLQNNSTRHVASSEDILHEHEARLEMELKQLVKDIQRVGDSEQPFATFAELFDDDDVANYYEALVGTLKAAKKKGLVTYEGQILLKGISDNVVISIV